MNHPGTLGQLGDHEVERFNECWKAKKGVGAMSELKSDFFIPGQSLVKYGQKRHMRALYEDGEVYFRAASEFDKEELGNARRDHELCREFSGKVQVECESQVIFPCADAIVPLTSSRDYYIHCLTAVPTLIE